MGFTTRNFAIEHCKDTVGLGTAGIRCHGHCRNIAGLGTVGHCRGTLRLSTAEALRLGIAGTLSGWALQGHSAVGHCRDILWLGAAGILCGWALQSDSGRRAGTT